MKHDLERAEVSPSLLHFSWIELSSEKWVTIYKVYKHVLCDILFHACQYQEISILPVYNNVVMSI